ncbi:glycosyltransferase family 2 protein [Sphingomonas bacterium]|uniref:glycosyltransferase family 2 protein n=1 Tax=Sphingomonas bacterium TaxID=1895847 RepID=UPI00157674A6|nr:glycosyltransferase family A protein [Sphingomonas bacterium]
MSLSSQSSVLPAYDVVIPCFDRSALIEDAVASVLAQSHRPARIIVVDDGSDDDTPDVLARMEQRQAIVQAVLLPRNQGASGARNAGLALARETWVAFLDSDDRWLPDAAKALLGAAAADRLDVIVGHFRRAWPDGRIDERECGWNGEDIRAGLARTGAVGPSWSMIRTATARSVGGFDPSFHNCNDWDFYTRAAAAGARFGRIDEAVALYHCAETGRLSHDRLLGGTNAARVLSHRYLASAGPRTL